MKSLTFARDFHLIFLLLFSSVLPLARRNARRSSCGDYTRKRVQVPQEALILSREGMLSKEEMDINARDGEDAPKNFTMEGLPPLAVAPLQQRQAVLPLKVDFAYHQAIIKPRTTSTTEWEQQQRWRK